MGTAESAHTVSRSFPIVGRTSITDARGRSVKLFDAHVRLWRDPPGLDFPQDDFRRVNAHLRRAVHQAAPGGSPQWAINTGIYGAAVIGLALVLLQVRPITLVTFIIAWIVVWMLVIGRVVKFGQSRPGASSWAKLAGRAAAVRRHPWQDAVGPYLSGLSSLMVPLILLFVTRSAPQSMMPVQRELVYGLCVLLVALAVFRILAVERRRARTFRLGATAVQIGDAMLAEGRCPACAYSIRALERMEDGCRVCPECGAAWRCDPQA